MEQQMIYNAQEAAAYLRINVVSLYRLVRDGQIKCFHVGRIYRFSEEQIQDFINSGGSSNCNENIMGGVTNGRP